MLEMVFSYEGGNCVAHWGGHHDGFNECGGSGFCQTLPPPHRRFKSVKFSDMNRRSTSL